METGKRFVNARHGSGVAQVVAVCTGVVLGKASCLSLSLKQRPAILKEFAQPSEPITIL